TPPTPPPTTSLFDFLYRYNDGGDYYYGTVADNGGYGYHTNQQLPAAAGSYAIFNQEADTTGAAPGSVFVTYYSHAGVAAASTTPFNIAHGLPSGLGGLGTEFDLMS